MGKLQVINPTLLRLSCDCGKYVHEIRRGEGGEVEYESFAKSGAEATDPDTVKDTTAKPKKKQWRSFFDPGD
jgi:hypothetical protein